MKVEDLAELVEDAELVANAGVRLGRIPDPLPLLNAIQTIRSEQVAGEAAPSSIITLQNELNSAVIRIFPITLYHLKSGWKPFSRSQGIVSTGIFVLSCILMLFVTSWCTMLYERNGFQLSLAQELHGARAQEIAFNLNAILKVNNKPLGASSSSADGITKDVFLKQLIELYQINKKQLSFSSTWNYLKNELSNPIYFFAPQMSSALSGNADSGYSGPYPEVLEKVKKDYGGGNANLDAYLRGERGKNTPIDLNFMGQICPPETGSREGQVSAASPGLTNASGSSRPHCVLSRELTEVSDLMAILGINLDPRGPSNMFNEIFRLQASIVLLGAWLLPAMYGILGSLIFHLRRFLDPANPNPRGITTIMRVILGGFGGVIVVWLLDSTSQNDSAKILVPFTHFGLAFLVGFSTDLLFQFLDASVSRAQSALTSLGAGGAPSR